MLWDESTDQGSVSPFETTLAAQEPPRSVLKGPDPNLGRRVGPYRIERLLGRGGMGVVYQAIREDEYEQRVALKLIDPDRLSTSALDRFYKERQILARLQHPHVARILDGGTTDEALPYFVMEYVEGEPIDRYCDVRQLSLRHRLELFRTVCSAVHFAHQNLVVHRDLKPGNILVTPEGVVKLLDFGIAQLLGDEPVRASSDRPDGQWLMTPRYASPEQILGQAITIASDIYSLGVLLYQLLTDQLPFHLRSREPKALIEAICEAEPMAPSDVVLQVGARGRRSRDLARKLRGDIDAIVRKALRREPHQRYASALEMADDIRRYFVDQPTRAHPPHQAYLATKFVRRNRLGLVAVNFLIVFALTVTLLWRQADRQRSVAEVARVHAESAQHQAERAQRQAETVSDFLEDLFKSADPDVAGADFLTVRDALEHGRQRLAGELADEPEIRAELLGTLGTVHARLGLHSDARELHEEALSTRRAFDPSDRTELATDLNNLGGTLYNLGEPAAAEGYFREALAMWQRLAEDASTELALRNLVAALMQQGRHEEALPLHQQALELQRQLYDAEDPRMGASLYALGALHRQRGEPDTAEPLLRQALAIYVSAFGPNHTDVANVQNSLGRVLQAQGRRSEARELLETALEARLGLLGEEHEKVASSRKNLAALLLEMGETAAAGALLGPAVDALRRSLPAEDWKILEAESVWGSYQQALGRLAEAERYLVASHQALQDRRGNDDMTTREARRRVVALYEAWGREEEAARYREPSVNER